MSSQSYIDKLEKLGNDMLLLDKKIVLTFTTFDLHTQINYKFDRLETKVDLKDTHAEIITSSITKPQLSESDAKAVQLVISNIEKFLAKYNELIDRPIIK